MYKAKLLFNLCVTWKLLNINSRQLINIVLVTMHISFVHVYLHLTIVHACLSSVCVRLIMFVFYFNHCQKVHKVVYKRQDNSIFIQHLQVLYLTCPVISCPAIWSVIFMYCIFSTPNNSWISVNPNIYGLHINFCTHSSLN